MWQAVCHLLPLCQIEVGRLPHFRSGLSVATIAPVAKNQPPVTEALREASVNLGPWLTDLFVASRLSRRALAQAVGVERTNLKGWLDDGKGMSAQSLLRFLSAVGARIDPPPPDDLPKSLNEELRIVREELAELRSSGHPFDVLTPEQRAFYEDAMVNDFLPADQVLARWGLRSMAELESRVTALLSIVREHPANSRRYSLQMDETMLTIKAAQAQVPSGAAAGDGDLAASVQTLADSIDDLREEQVRSRSAFDQFVARIEAALDLDEPPQAAGSGP